MVKSQCLIKKVEEEKKEEIKDEKQEEKAVIEEDFKEGEDDKDKE